MNLNQNKGGRRGSVHNQHDARQTKLSALSSVSQKTKRLLHEQRKKLRRQRRLQKDQHTLAKMILLRRNGTRATQQRHNFLMGSGTFPLASAVSGPSSASWASLPLQRLIVPVVAHPPATPAYTHGHDSHRHDPAPRHDHAGSSVLWDRHGETDRGDGGNWLLQPETTEYVVHYDNPTNPFGGVERPTPVSDTGDRQPTPPVVHSRPGDGVRSSSQHEDAYSVLPSAVTGAFFGTAAAATSMRTRGGGTGNPFSAEPGADTPAAASHPPPPSRAAPDAPITLAPADVPRGPSVDRDGIPVFDWRLPESIQLYPRLVPSYSPFSTSTASNVSGFLQSGVRFLSPN